MDLWIRSQDKSQLMKIDNLKVKYETAQVLTNQYESHNEEIGYCILNTNEIIAVYKTQERALEVLDEIQDKLANTNYDGLKDDYVIKTNTFVYQMPKE